MLERIEAELAKQEREARREAAAGRRHPFKSTTRALSGGPCAYCGKALMEGLHK